MAAPHWRLILNGKSATNGELRDAVAHWRGQGVQLEVRVTWEEGDAERHVVEAVDQLVDVIVAAGGDGTLNAVAGALANVGRGASDLPSLGLVPLGTANDFATAAGIPVQPGEALALIGQGAVHAIDLLQVDADGRSRWCVNLASGGFGTEVTRETDAGLKQRLGGLAYVLTGITRLGRIEPISAHLRGADFSWQGNFIALGIGNGRQAGGGQSLCPQALIDDGQLDVTVIAELEGEFAETLGQVLASGAQAVVEQHFTRARLPWLELQSQQPLTLNLDGEPIQALRFRIDCVPGKVRMHLPSDCPLLR